MKGIGYLEDCSKVVFVIDSATPHNMLRIGTIIVLSEKLAYEIVSAEVNLISEEKFVKEGIGGYSSNTQLLRGEEFGSYVMRPIINLYVKRVNPKSIDWEAHSERVLEDISWKPQPKLAVKKESLTPQEAIDYAMSSKKTRDKIRNILKFKRLSRKRVEEFLSTNKDGFSSIIGFPIEEKEEE